MPIRILQCVCAVLFAAALFAPAQEPVKSPLNPRVITATKQVTIFSGLERQMLHAVQKKDKSALAAMLQDDCTIELPDADPLAGDEWMDSVMAQDYNLKSFVVRQMSVADLGNAVVVKFDRIQEAVAKGVADSGEFFVVDVWKKNGDAWKLANRYVAKVSSVPWMPVSSPTPTGKQ